MTLKAEVEGFQDEALDQYLNGFEKNKSKFGFSIQILTSPLVAC